MQGFRVFTLLLFISPFSRGKMGFEKGPIKQPKVGHLLAQNDMA